MALDASSELTRASSSNFAPPTIAPCSRSIFVLPSASEVVSLTLIRMCRACVWSTTVGWLRLRIVDELHDMKAAGAAHDCPTPRPASSCAPTSAKTDGSRAGVRQPRLPPCSASGASEYDAATWAKSLPELDLRKRRPPRACAAYSICVGRRLLGNGHVHVRELVFVLAARLRGDRREIVVDLGVGDGDLAVDLTLAHALDDDLRGGYPRDTPGRRCPRARAACETRRA